jgi:hypothetical protein
LEFGEIKKHQQGRLRRISQRGKGKADRMVSLNTFEETEKKGATSSAAS